MASPSPHPRRRYLYNSDSSDPSPRPLYPLSISASNDSAHSLKKSATFHSPTTPPLSGRDPILNVPSLPRRSPTSSKDLENTIAAGDDRIAQLIGAVDRSFSGLVSFTSDGRETLTAEALPVPRFMVKANSRDQDPEEMDLDHPSPLIKTEARPANGKHHASDSGIGSTETSSSVLGDNTSLKQEANVHDVRENPSRINGVGEMAGDSARGLQHALSEYACKQIQKHIILPIIREEKLKNFHPLVGGIPYRVARKEITCLRDLEKVLFWLAPKWSASKASFLLFCETSIQCIHTTVEYLNERDQRRPTDRPYTNGYFLDLVEQVRQYASMVASSRARSASGSTPRNAPTSDERLGLVGGLSQTGRPAELVKIKDGRSISLRTGEEVSPDDFKHGTKRAVDDESEEDALRSMARRRKSAGPAVKEQQRCRDCSKVFKRPCDLTKHEKTHSRPWKCSEVDCKYHEYGWPTEKERDRHVNDKHSAAPSMFKCQFYPCPYESKRESNCKQHMEKAHGWVYVRSKNNGRTPKGPQPGRTPPTPQISTPGSAVFNVPTPDFSDAQPVFETSEHQPMNAVQAPMTGEPSTSFPAEHVTSFNDTFGPIDTHFSWNDASTDYNSASVTNYTSSSHRPSWDSTMNNFTVPPNLENESLFGTNFDWSNMNHDLASLNIQLITPATSIEQRPLGAFSRNNSISLEQSPTSNNQPPSLSTGAQADAMLYSPYSMQETENSSDEGYGEFTQDLVARPVRDFNLFDSNTGPALTDANNGVMFGELPQYGVPSGWSGRGTDLAHQLGIGGELIHIDE